MIILLALFNCSQDLQSISLSPLNPVLGPNGMATAVNPGTTTVTATYGTIVGNTALTIGTTTKLSLSITAPGNPTGSASPTIPAGLYQQFTATATYPDFTQQDVTSLVSWSSSNTASATINPVSGLAKGVFAGSSSITAIYGTVSSPPVTLTVSGATPTTILVTAIGNPSGSSNPFIPIGLNQQFAATGIYNGTPYDITNSVTWASNNTAIAEINSATGLATAVGTGTAMISATYPAPALTSSLNLTVINAAINSISVSAPGNSVSVSNPVVLKGLTQQLTATGIFSDGHSYNITPYVIWSSNSPFQLFVNSNGLVTASGGQGNSALITAAYNGLVGGAAGNIQVVINSASLEAITLLPANPVISNGLNLKFIAIGKFSDQSQADISAMVGWSIAAATPSIATISNSYSQQMTATGSYNGGSGNISSLATWSSDDPSVAFVNAYGTVFAIGPGTTTVNASYQGVADGTTVTVFTPVLNFISITPQNNYLSINSSTGTSLQYFATGFYSDGTTRDMTGTVTWSSASANVAQFESTTAGLITALSAGTSTITATAGSISANTILTVN